MGLIASLDMGSEKMVMALGATDGTPFRLTGIKMIASQGMERGMVKDKQKVRACARGLVSELLKERKVEAMHIAMAGDSLRVTEKRVTVPLQRKVVEQNDIFRAEQRCCADFGGGQDELIDMIPVAYSIDRGELMANPMGKAGRNLEVTYQVYTAGYDYLAAIREMFDGCGVGDIYFYPSTRAYSEALNIVSANDFALIDMGAMGTQVVLYRDGMLEYEAYLPLGTRSIDNDIVLAFAVSAGQARKLKHEAGQALRSACKNKKIQIPDTKLTLESRDLAMVVQSRTEELLEGAVYLLQSWGFDSSADEVVLTGGGSRLADVDILLSRLSGHPVVKAVVKNIQTSRDEVLRTPEYLVALGLLLCQPFQIEESRSSIGEKLTKGLKDLFGI